MWPFGSKAVTKVKQHEPVEVFCDLDELISRKVGFRFKGNVYNIQPLELRQFLAVANTLARLDDLRVKKSKDERGLLNAYQDLFDKTVEPRIVVEDMHYVQVSALFNTVLECIMGKAQVDYEKKSQIAMATVQNLAKSLTPESAQPSG